MIKILIIVGLLAFAIALSGCVGGGESDIIIQSGGTNSNGNFTANVQGQPAVSDSVTFVEGTNISLAENASAKTITITSTAGGGSSVTYNNYTNYSYSNGTVLNATACNPANEASVFNPNWQGLGVNGFDCISVLDDDSIYLTSEQDPVWTAASSSVAYTANQGTWNVNSSNSSSYWAGLLAPLPSWGTGCSDCPNATLSSMGITWNQTTSTVNANLANWNATCTNCPNDTVANNQASWTAKLSVESDPLYQSNSSTLLHNVSLTNTLLDQILTWNGASWINSNMTMPASGGQGVQLFFNNTPAGGGYESLKTYPDTNSEQDESTVVNNNISLFERYKSDALGGIQIDGGEWYFDIYTYVSQNAGTTELIFNVSKMNTTNNVTTLLFSVTTGDINYTVLNGMTSVSMVQPSYAINSSDVMLVNVTAKTNSVLDTTVHFVHSGSAHYSHIHTPLITRHNDLSGLQGGASGQYYHLNQTEYGQIPTWNTVTGKLDVSTYSGNFPNNSLINYLLTSTYNGNFPNTSLGNYLGSFPNNSLAGAITTLNTTTSNLGNNDTNDRSYVNSTFLKQANISSCTGTDKLTTANGYTLTCATDQTGAGSGTPFTQYNNSIKKQMFMNISNLTVALPLTSGKQVTGECSLLTNQSAATVGLQMWVNISGSDNQVVSVRYPGTATSFILQSGETANTNVAATAGGGTSIAETTIRWYSNQTSAGIFNITMKKEPVTGYAWIFNGSYCRSIET